MQKGLALSYVMIHICSAWVESFTIPGPQHRTDWPCW